MAHYGLFVEKGHFGSFLCLLVLLLLLGAKLFDGFLGLPRVLQGRPGLAHIFRTLVHGGAGLRHRCSGPRPKGPVLSQLSRLNTPGLSGRTLARIQLLFGTGEGLTLLLQRLLGMGQALAGPLRFVTTKLQHFLQGEAEFLAWHRWKRDRSC